MPERDIVPQRLLDFSRHLRRDQSSPERIVWGILRNRRFLGLKFRRQHPLGPFILDFYCEEFCWAIEVDGGQHNTNESRLYDKQRTEFLDARGIRVSRYWSHEVLDERDAFIQGLANVVESLRREQLADGTKEVVRQGTLTPALSQGEREIGTRGSGQEERD